MWVIDTSVVVSALISKKMDTPPRRILANMLKGEIEFWLSTELLEEYREVLQRPTVRKLHSLTDAELESIFVTLMLHAHWIEPAESDSPAPDSGDNHLWALLQAVPGAALVTGDKLLQDNPPSFARVISPRQFLSLSVLQ